MPESMKWYETLAIGIAILIVGLFVFLLAGGWHQLLRPDLYH